MAKIAADNFDSKNRATAVGFYLSGARLGYAATPIVIGFLIAQYSWRAAFYITGLGSLVWCVLWYFFYQENKDTAAVKSVADAKPIRAAHRGCSC